MSQVKAKLIFMGKSHAGQVYELTLEKTTVGRAGTNTLVITDPSLSAVHCEILTNGSEVIVRDLGSRNGTFVNGVKLTNQQSQLTAGQTVRFGSVEARLELHWPQSSDDSVSDITSIKLMSRIMRDQRRERAQPKPNPSMKLDSPDAGPPEDQTVATVRTPSSAIEPLESTAPAVPFQAENQPRTNSRPLSRIIVAALALGLLILLWLWWRGK